MTLLVVLVLVNFQFYDKERIDYEGSLKIDCLQLL